MPAAHKQCSRSRNKTVTRSVPYGARQVICQVTCTRTSALSGNKGGLQARAVRACLCGRAKLLWLSTRFEKRKRLARVCAVSYEYACLVGFETFQGAAVRGFVGAGTLAMYWYISCCCCCDSAAFRLSYCTGMGIRALSPVEISLVCTRCLSIHAAHGRLFEV